MSRVLSTARTVARTGVVNRAFQARFMSAFLPADEVYERVANVVGAFDKVDADKISKTAHFTTDLGSSVCRNTAPNMRALLFFCSFSFSLLA